MAENEKQISGRKIFFLNPASAVKSVVINRLKIMEYEVYVLDDYRLLKGTLSHFSDSICFITTTPVLSIEGWNTFIKSVNNDPKCQTADLGLITDSLPDNRKAELIKDLTLSGGTFCSLQAEELLREIVKSLDKLEARGMRKYVRVNCITDKSAELYWFTENKMYKLKLLDISSAGTATMLPLSQANAVYVNKIIDNVMLTINNRQFPVIIKVTAIKATEKFLLVVFMFQMETEKTSIEAIRDYISEVLKEDMHRQVSNFVLDKERYEPTKKA